MIKFLVDHFFLISAIGTVAILFVLCLVFLRRMGLDLLRKERDELKEELEEKLPRPTDPRWKLVNNVFYSPIDSSVKNTRVALTIWVEEKKQEGICVDLGTGSVYLGAGSPVHTLDDYGLKVIGAYRRRIIEELTEIPDEKPSEEKPSVGETVEKDEKDEKGEIMHRWLAAYGRLVEEEEPLSHMSLETKMAFSKIADTTRNLLRRAER